MSRVLELVNPTYWSIHSRMYRTNGVHTKLIQTLTLTRWKEETSQHTMPLWIKTLFLTFLLEWNAYILQVAKKINEGSWQYVVCLIKRSTHLSINCFEKDLKQRVNYATLRIWKRLRISNGIFPSWLTAIHGYRNKNIAHWLVAARLRHNRWRWAVQKLNCSHQAKGTKSLKGEVNRIDSYFWFKM